MKVLKKENKVFCYHVEDEMGDYIKDNTRYHLNNAREVYAPDSADLSMYVEVDSVEDYVKTYMSDYEYKPLTEEEREEIMKKHSEKSES